MAMQLVETTEGPRIHVPLNIKKRSGRKQIVVLDTPETQVPEARLEPGVAYHDAMVVAFARAFRWKRMLDEGRYCSIAEMGEALGINRFYLARMMRLTLLAPCIVEAVVDGREPDGMSIERLRRPMPTVWDEQKHLLDPRSALLEDNSTLDHDGRRLCDQTYS